MPSTRRRPVLNARWRAETRPPTRRPAASRLAASLLFASCVTGLAAAAPTGQAVASTAGLDRIAPASAGVIRSTLDQSPAIAYRLIDTWSDRAWQPRAGRYRDAVDIGSMPDGSLVLLDDRSVDPERYPALHFVAPDGRATRLLRLTDGDTRLAPDRLDVDPDGQIYLLWTSQQQRRPSARLEAWSPVDGRRLGSWSFDESYVDVALGPDGRIYLARSAESATLGPAAVDVYAPDGQRVEMLRPPEMDTPIRVDVDRDGTVYVLQEVPPPPTPREPGGPRPPPGPSALDADPVPGVLIFDAAHAYRETVPFEFGIDVAAGPAGIFVARYGQAFALRESEPLMPLVDQAWTGELALEAPSGGALFGSLSHCEFEGLIAFPQPELRPAPYLLSGGMDHPALEGPVWPLRLAAGADTALLQGRFGPSPAEDLRQADYLPSGTEPQSVQRWNASGALESQIGLCGGGGPVGTALDLALDGATVYVADATCVERRSGDGFADWRRCLNGLWAADAGTRIAAVAADGGRLAVLDAGGGGLALLDAEGQLLDQWTLSEPGAALSSAYVDLDLSGERLALADAGRARVELRDLAGTVLGGFDLPDRPQSLAFGPEGDVYVLGQGGWALRYAPDGRLAAAWRLPEPDMPVRDLAVADDGRVLISFGRSQSELGWAPIDAAGVWVFVPGPPATALPPGPDACRAAPDKRALPERLPLGDEVRVTLEIDGACPPKPAPLRLMIVFDTSRSMNWGYALDRAKQVVIGLLGELDPRRVEVGLVTFDEVEALAEPPSRDLLGLARRTAGLRARGDTLMSGAIDLARGQLPRVGLPAGSRRAILIVTDANPSDDTLVALRAASADGIALSAVVVQEGQVADPSFLDALAGAGGRVLVDPASWELPGLAGTLLAADPQPGLFETLELVDDVPANMRYVVGSSSPPASFDAARNRLTWRLGPLSAAEGMRVEYRLLPLEVGVWPTNVQADAAYVDALGQTGALRFPIPKVEVYAGRRWPLYLPLLSRGHCPRPARPVDVVLVIDTSSSMAEPANAALPEGPSKLDAALQAASTFVGLLGLPSDRAALVAFDGASRREIGLSGDLTAIRSALARQSTGQGTRIDLGLAEAAQLLAAEGRDGALPVTVLLTDGLQAGGDAASVLDAAAALKSAGAILYAIGLGDGVDAALLAELASTPERYFASPDAEALQRIYDRISVRLACE